MIQNDKLDFTFKIKSVGKDHFKVVSNCSYPQLEDANDLKNRILANHFCVERLESEYERYAEFVKKYEGTMASLNRDSNFAENKAIYLVLQAIIANKREQMTITQESQS